MSSLFSAPQIPQAAPLPVSPLLDQAKQQQAQAAADATTAGVAAGGRASTIFAGRSIAADQLKARRLSKAGTASDLGLY